MVAKETERRHIHTVYCDLASKRLGWGTLNIKYNCVNKHEAIYRNYYYNISNKKKIIFIINI